MGLLLLDLLPQQHTIKLITNVIGIDEYCSFETVCLIYI